jgi:hypothetical protein
MSNSQPPQGFLQVFRVLARNVNFQLAHRFDGQRVHFILRLSSGTEDVESVAGQMPEKSFRHLVAAGIPGTKNEYVGLHIWANVSRRGFPSKRHGRPSRILHNSVYEAVVLPPEYELADGVA